MFQIAAIISGIVLVVALGLLLMAWSDDLDHQDAQARDSSRLARRLSLRRATKVPEGAEAEPAGATPEPPVEPPAAPAGERAKEPDAAPVEAPVEAEPEAEAGPTWVASAESQSSF